MTYLAASLHADALCPVRGQGLQPAVDRATTPRRWPGLSGPNDTPMAHAGVLALPQDGIPAPPGDHLHRYPTMKISECPLLTGLNSTWTARPAGRSSCTSMPLRTTSEATLLPPCSLVLAGEFRRSRGATVALAPSRDALLAFPAPRPPVVHRRLADPPSMAARHGAGSRRVSSWP
jgi:hypothetical protein